MGSQKEQKVRYPLKWWGGKQNLIKYILPLLPSESTYDTYTEVFCGGAALFFSKNPVMNEILNDLDGQLINFYRMLRHPVGGKKLKRQIDGTLYSRAEFNRAKAVNKDPQSYGRVTQAWALFVLCNQSKMATRTHWENGLLAHNGKRDYKAAFKFNIRKQIDYAAIQQRMETVIFENRDALKVLQQYDHAAAFHFIDPPYIGTVQAYKADKYTEVEYEQLLQFLTTCKGKFMLCGFLNELTDRYAQQHGWRKIEFKQKKSAGTSTGKAQKIKVEVLWLNYEPAQKTLF